MPYVYVIENPSIPGLVKIGCTNDVARRVKELQTTGFLDSWAHPDK
jgi:predicted GIY-YIG superfamily endonuclease